MIIPTLLPLTRLVKTIFVLDSSEKSPEFNDMNREVAPEELSDEDMPLIPWSECAN